MSDKSKPMTPADLRAMFALSWEELKQKQQANVDAWGLGGSERWDANLDTREIAFTFPMGLIVTAPFQIVGSHNEEEGAWLWGWANPSVDPELAEHAQLVRRLGEQQGIPEFTTAKIESSETDAEQYTALACHLAGAAGIYRGPAGPTNFYFTFGPVTFHQVN